MSHPDHSPTRPRKSRLTRVRYLLPLLGPLALAPPAAGDVFLWTKAAGTTDWNTAGNWGNGSLGFPNAPTADVLFTAGGVGAVNVSAGVQVQSLNFTNAAGGYTLTSDAGQTLSGLTAITIGANVTGTQTIDLAKVATGSLLFAGSGPGALTITNNAADTAAPTLVIGPNTIIGTPGTGGVTVTGSGFTRLSGSFTAAATTQVVGGLTKGGTGRLELTGSNAHLTGPGNVSVTLTGGTLAVNADAALGAADQALKLDANSATAGGLEFLTTPAGVTVARPVTLASTTRVVSTGADVNTVAGRVTGAGQLVKAGPGTLVLSNGANAYAGGTAVTGGTLTLGVAGALPAGGAVTVTDGTLDLNGNGPTIGALTFGASLVASPTVRTGGALTLGGDVTVAAGAGTKGAVVSGAFNLGGATRTVTIQGSSDHYYDLVLTGPVGGAGGLTLDSPLGGGLALAGANVYTGPTTVTQGFLYAAAANALPATAVTLAGVGATLDLRPPAAEGGVTAGSYSQTIGSLAGGAGSLIHLGAATLTVGTDDTSTTFAGRITDSGGGSLVKVGAGTLTLSHANDYAGGTTITGGTLKLGAAGALPGGGAVTVTNATLDLNGTSQSIGTLTFGASAAAGPTVATGGGTLTLGGDVTFAGGFGTKAAIVGGALDLGGATRTVTIQHVSSQSYDVILAGPVGGTGGLTLAGTGSGALALAAANTYTGPTTVTAGRLYAAAAGALPAGTAVALTSGFADLALNPPATEGGVTAGSYGQSIGSLAGVAGSRVFLGAATLTVGSDNTSTAFAGSFLGSGGSLVKVGSGTLTLGGTGDYAGGTTITGGALSVGTDTHLGDPAGRLTLGGGALKATASFASSRPTTLDTDGTFDVAAGATLIWNGPVGGTGGLTKTGTGTLVLGGAANSYAGGTVLSGGTLKLGAAGARPAGSAVTITGGTLDLNGTNQTIAALTFGPTAVARPTVVTGGGTLTLGGDVTFAGGPFGAVVNGPVDLGGATRTVTIQSPSVQFYDVVLNGPVGGGGGLTLDGSPDGRLVLNAAGSYTGPTTVKAGRLVTAAANALPAATAVNLAGSGAALDLSPTNTQSGVTAGSYSQTVSSLDGVAGSQVYLTGTSLVVSGDGNGTFAGNLVGPGILVKAGAGTLTLSGTNTHSGGTVVLGGAVSVGADAHLGDRDGPLTLRGGVLRATASFTSSHPATLNDGGSTFDVATGMTLTWGGPISGTGTLTKAGPGTLVLASAANAYAGGTAVTDGKLRLSGGANRLPAGGAVTVTNATLDVGKTNQAVGALTFGISSATNPTVAGTGGGTLTLGGDVTFAGGPFGAIVSSAVDLGGAARTVTVQFNSNQIYDVVITGSVGGTGGLTLAGPSARVALAKANTYIGPTTVTSGVLHAAADNALPFATAVNVAGGATLSLNPLSTENGVTAGSYSQTVGSLAGAAGSRVNLGGATLAVGTDDTSTTFAGRIVGSGFLAKVGAGTLTLGAPNVYAGGTSITGGALSVGADAHLGDPGGPLWFGGGALKATASFASARVTTLYDGGGTFDVAGGMTLTWNGPISGSGGGALTKAGGGTLVLSNAANDYTGGTAVTGGTLSVAADAVLGGAAGGLTLSGGAALAATASFASARPATLGSGGGTFDVAGGTTLSWTGPVSGGGTLTKAGPGTLVLGGTANDYAGGTVVTGGTLRVTGATGPGSVLVTTGGTLGGTGRAAGAVSVTGGGVIAPGDGAAPGTLALGGGLMLAPGSVFSVVAGDAGASALAVAGPLDVTGGTRALAIVNDGSLVGGRAYTYTIATMSSTLGFTPTSFAVTAGNFDGFLGTPIVTNPGGTVLMVSFTPVPEPARVLALCGAAAGAAGWARFWRRRWAGEVASLP